MYAFRIFKLRTVEVKMSGGFEL